MKKTVTLVFLLLVLGGGGYVAYDYMAGGLFFPKNDGVEMTMTEKESTPVEKLHLAEIRSFKVPVLHNAVAVKFLVFHVLLNVETHRQARMAERKMNNLVDMYIRYLVAHFEINSVGQILNRTEISRILEMATREVLGDSVNLKNVIIQGVFQKNAGV